MEKEKDPLILFASMPILKIIDWKYFLPKKKKEKKKKRIIFKIYHKYQYPRYLFMSG